MSSLSFPLALSRSIARHAPTPRIDRAPPLEQARSVGTGLAVAVALLGLTAEAPLALAQEKDKEKLIPGDFTATVALATDYSFRGISQTDNGFAVQGTIDYAYMFKKEIGLYLGVFGSNLDFNDNSEATIEVDLYGGVKGEVAGFAWSLGMIGYLYPGAKGSLSYDYYEVAAKLGYDFGVANLTGGVNYSPDYFADSGSGVYVSGDVAVPLPFLPFDMALALHGGHQSIDKNGRFGTPDYWDWSVGITGKVEGFTLSLQYVDTDLGRGECFGGRSLCKSRAVFTVSRSF